MRFASCSLALLSSAACLCAAHHEEVLRDKPVAYWRFDDAIDCCAQEASFDRGLKADRGENVSLVEPGPRGPLFGGFDMHNLAADFTAVKSGAFLRVKDPGAGSVFDFTTGQTVTIEAWVRCDRLADNQNVYVIGKGRTGNAGCAEHNQGWALRLRGVKTAKGVLACPSFLFRDERNEGEGSWHRWTTARGFAPGAEWHHVAVTYTFGKPESAKAWVNGVELAGAWDMGGPTTLGPVVDDDEVWIGGSIGGQAASQFPGALDEVAVFRSQPQPERLALRARREGPVPELHDATPQPMEKKEPAKPPVPVPVIAREELPAKAVRIEVLEFPADGEEQIAETFENDSAQKNTTAAEPDWARIPPLKTAEFTEPAFVLASLPQKYNARGVRADRSRPFLLRLAGVVTLPPGEHTVHLRALTATRVAWDAAVVTETPIKRRKYGDTEPVPDQFEAQLVKTMPLLPAGHYEVQGKVLSDGRPHVVVIESWVGGKTVRPEHGELSLWVSNGGTWNVLSPAEPVADYAAFTAAQRTRIEAMDARNRRVPAEDAYWKMRHDLARKHAPPAPAAPATEGALNAVDAFILTKLRAAGVKPAPLCDDAAFLRRATLDTIGRIPTAEEAAAFLEDKSPDKRARAIDRLLSDPGWADHWTSYWQDVLAENPNMLKGTLNNTGPFRWWIHESLADNKPLDRFVTELVAMEGSPNYGGPAGFAIATQNDLPMAAKAQVIASAFLASEMKCARCHDAVHHSFEQRELFQLAAMLGRSPLKVPETSLTKGLSANSHVTVTLKAGEIIHPHYPFGGPKEPLPGVLRREGDSRELLGAILTDPRNERFAQVMVNRLWRQFMGFGIVEPVDDWETSLPSHKELLRWLAHELVTHDYDAKHVARLILNSATYQRVVTPEASAEVTSSERLFASQARRRMTAEQLLDSLMLAAGQQYATEPLTFDPEGRQNAKDHGHLGVPRRAWEFAALSNERDRPALAKPRAQIFADVLAAFGWRESRPEPRSTRDHEANIIQPALLANGTFGALVVRAHDDSALTELALRAKTAGDLVQSLYLKFYGRNPRTGEAAALTALLAPGFDTRLTGADRASRPRGSTKSVSWSSHLNPDATTTILEIEREVKAGLPPTPRLTSDWRDRFEDAVWALMLSPEFIHIP